jgi:N6-adenosine-specific RNA methylase IME4
MYMTVAGRKIYALPIPDALDEGTFLLLRIQSDILLFTSYEISE